MTNISNFKSISKIIQTKFNYKKPNNKLYKFISNYPYHINYIILYDFMVIIYHSHFKKYDNAISTLKLLHNKYRDFRSTDRAVIIDVFNIYYNNTKIDIFAILFILNITSCVKLLNTNKQLANIYNIQLSNIQIHIENIQIIPKIYIIQMLDIINNNKK